MSEETRTALEAAKGYLRDELSVLAVRGDGSKAPLHNTWVEYQTRRMTESEAERVFTNGQGVAIIGGDISGGLAVFDFDYPGFFEKWAELVEDVHPGLLARAPRVKTPSDGYHVYVRTKPSIGSMDLAKAAEKYVHPVKKKPGQVYIETKGAGGYVLAPGSGPNCHELGREYVHVSGPPIDKAPLLTSEEIETLLAVARSFNEAPEPAYKHDASRQITDEERDRPGYIYNDRSTADDMLRVLSAHGWSVVRQKGDGYLVARPGKERGISGTIGLVPNTPEGFVRFHNFSSSASMRTGSMTAFTLFAHLEHGDDWSGAAKQLWADGYQKERGSFKTNPVTRRHSETREIFSKIRNNGIKNGTFTAAEMPDEEPEEEEPEFNPVIKDHEEQGIRYLRGDKTIFIPTGIPVLDERNGGGLPAQQVSVVTAYTGIGKSEFCRQLKMRAIAQDFPVVTVDVELGSFQIWQRDLSQISNVAGTAVNERIFVGDEEKRVMDGIEQLNKVSHLHRFVELDGGIPLEDLAVYVEEALKELNNEKPALVIIDSIQRLAMGSSKSDVRTQVADFMHFLTRYAKRWNAAVLATSEQKRSAKGGAPKAGEGLTSGAESRSIEFQPHTLISLFEKQAEADDGEEDEGWKPREISMYLEKTRSGQKGPIPGHIEFKGPCWSMDVVSGSRGLRQEILNMVPPAPDLISARAISRQISKRPALVVSVLKSIQENEGSVSFVSHGKAKGWTRVHEKGSKEGIAPDPTPDPEQFLSGSQTRIRSTPLGSGEKTPGNDYEF